VPPAETNGKDKQGQTSFFVEECGYRQIALSGPDAHPVHGAVRGRSDSKHLLQIGVVQNGQERLLGLLGGKVGVDGCRNPLLHTMV
jgi:hypothetical protein